ncbi:hypothetical protein KJZ71_01160 [Patescibacteria group bacterium]|nr:hypothetical protein [Patescibacteria group bacterium]
MMKRLLFATLIVAAAVAGSVSTSMVPPVQAQVGAGLAEVGQTVKLPDTDPRVIAARIINVALGLLAMVMVVIIVYAGFLYMTSGGSPEKTAKAIAWIRNAVIGLIIILASWAIARYVIDKLLEATGGGGGVTVGGGGGPGGGFGGAGGASAFRLISITPQGKVDTKKVIIKIVLNKPVDEQSASSPGMVTVTRMSDGATVPGTIEVTNATIRFTSTSPCPPPNNNLFCFDDDSEYRVNVSPNLQAATGQTLTCGGFAPSCEATFTTGSTVDVTPPTVSLTWPIDGQPVSADALVDVNAFASDDVAIGYVSFYDEGSWIGDDAPPGQSPGQYDAHVQWDTAGLAPGSQRTLLATAYDVDSGNATSQPVTVVLRPAHCFDGVQNGGEQGIDCGGDPNDVQAYCGACAGGACTTNTNCASGVCQNGVCVEQPIITSVTPNDGAVGNYVTLKGVNFGTNGKVTFLGQANPVDAVPPQSCVAAGVNTWSPTQVVIEVPVGAENGPLRLTNNASGLSDSTNAPPNPFINDFLVNSTVRPGICAAVPGEGQPGSLFRLYGTGFGTTAAGITFGPSVLSSSSWTNERIEALIPSINVGKYAVTVSVGTETSNPVDVGVLGAYTGGPPELFTLDPSSGPVGTYVTLTGKNFGFSIGQVLFKDLASGNIALADTSFPPACSEAFWGNTSITVKVPKNFTQGSTGPILPGSYTVQVIPGAAGAPPSNALTFDVNTNPLGAGICRVDPRVGPVGTSLLVYGENFTAGPGAVTFHQNVNGTVGSWANTEISSAIPIGALTGPVTVTPSANNVASNGYNIEVRNCNEAANVCAPSEECCGDGTCRIAGQCVAGAGTAMFAWRSSTGLIPRAPRVVEECKAGEIPSPAPWSNRPGGDQACVNAAITMRFTQKLEPTTVTPPAKNFDIFECTGGGQNPCTEQTPVPLASGFPQLLSANSEQDYVRILVQGNLKTATTYEVKVKTEVKGFGPEGGTMIEDAAKCGNGYAYCFRFTTRADSAECAIGSVEVAPDPYHASDEGIKIPYGAVPIAKEDACVVLACEAYDWSWDTGLDGRASITNNQDFSQSPPRGACVQTATTILETGKDPVKVNATALGVKGSGDLFINFIPPRVINHGPDCDEACVNAAIWATFNVALDPASVHAGNVELKQCANQSCFEFTKTISIANKFVTLTAVPGTTDPRLRFIEIDPVADPVKAGDPLVPLLEPGKYYRVVLKGGFLGGIQSVNKVPMTGLNSPEGFAWTFRVKPGDAAFCEADRIDMAPTEKYEKAVGAKQGFSAHPFSQADACSETGQMLVALQGFSWSSSKTDVASLLFNGQLDTGAELPAGCGNTCRNTGASGPAGSTAQCGNGIVETTNAAYCKNGKTMFGQTCVLLPAGGKGGEECDDANDNANDACSNTCLWNPVPNVSEGGTCGNGNIDIGEDCDFGRICMGAAATSTTPNGTDCTTASAAIVCASNGGTCQTRLYRGCSPTCQNLGAQAGNSTCGNADIADGEDCDDGNSASGDGCSANCLHEGSSKTVVALCGNGKLEPGESCEKTGAIWPVPWCNSATCLNTGVAPCTASGQTNCCGNGNALEPGKDCDDFNAVNGDGCSALCLLEGSSKFYAQPSFCGDSTLGTGEQCDAAPPGSGGDGFVDPYQIATIVGKGQTDAAGKMSSDISASFQAKTGTAVYGLQCGFTDERSCSTDSASYSSETGLTDNGCCSLRPKLANAYPPSASAGVCRNVLINGAFNTAMNEQSLANNFVVAKRVPGPACPSGTNDVTDLFNPPPTGFRGFVFRVWQRILHFFGAQNAYAQRWCSGTVTGALEFSKGKDTNGADITLFSFKLDSAFEPQTEYRVRFLGDASASPEPLADNNVPALKQGIKTAQGVVAKYDNSDNGPLSWTFTTGNVICAINAVNVMDLDASHPNFWYRADESHPFLARAESLVNGVVVPLSTTAEYAWAWQNWVVSNKNLAAIEQGFPSGSTNAATTGNVVSRNVSGSGYLSARVRVTNDTVNVPATTDLVVQGTAPLTMNICENPWPSIATAPFRDQEGSLHLKNTIFEQGPFYNFALTYCRDAGVTGPKEDLPALVMNAVPPNPADAAQGILRQYLFTFQLEALKKDAIGLRVVANPLHLSPLEWYRSKGFKGNPQQLTVDGYQAIRDGRTVYIAGVNTEGPDANGKSTEMFTNIYLLSYNEGAEPETRQIFDALLERIAFNTNIQYDVANACQDSLGSLVEGEGGAVAECTADWECDKYGNGMRCANFKGKVQRDLMRLSDFQSITKALNGAKKSTGGYPELSSGSFLPGISTSRWPSWTDAFSKAATPEGGAAMPADPINRFVTCGRCSESKTACVTNDDCPRSGETCASVDGFAPDTCWNADSLQFRCPADEQGSHFYQYRTLAVGERFELASDFEVPPPNAADVTKNWWNPPLFEQVKQCANPEASGNFCQADADCRVCPLGICQRCSGGTKNGEACTSNAQCGGGVCQDVVPIIFGACQPVGGSYRYSNVCKNQTYGSSGTCGDGVIDSDPKNSKCLGGPNDNQPCTSSSQCAGFTCELSEICEITGPTAQRWQACTTLGNTPGQKSQTCLGCRQYVDDVSQPGCFALKQCGNGKVDGVCSNNPTQQCVTSKDCAGGATCDREVCDDGLQNGTYGHCNETCTGFGSYCGDGKLGLGESCDAGLQNGAYCGSGCNPQNSCNLTCNGPAPYCGDLTTTAPEQCDGNSLSTPKALCTKGDAAKLDTPCDTDADCGTAGKCGPDLVASSQDPNWGNIFITNGPVACGTTSVCAGPGGRCKAGSASTGFTPCLTDADCPGDTCFLTQGHRCGNDTVCGAGTCVGTYQMVHTRACGNPGSSNACTFGQWSDCHPEDYCGDGVKQASEQCDDGNTDNNDACTNACTLNVCGDGAVFKGVEECDQGSPFIGGSNGKPCTTAEYGATCTSCTTSCKIALTQGGYCGDGIKQPNTAEQCDTAGNTSVPVADPNLTCKGLGFDYAKQHTKVTATSVPNAVPGGGCYIIKKNPIPAPPGTPGNFIPIFHMETNVAVLKSGTQNLPLQKPSGGPQPNVTEDDILYTLSLPPNTVPVVPVNASQLCIGAKVSFSNDIITCSQSCGYSGCAYCGDTPGVGQIGGKLQDTLFQQPVPFARVTLFYRGLQVAVTESDTNGIFSFQNLDTHTGCDQYRIVVDSYEDNPHTVTFDESKRGGYLPVKVGPFTSDMTSFKNAVVNNELGIAITADIFGTGDISAPQINMLPRLGPNEYIAQFWWDPCDGKTCPLGDPNGIDKTIKAYQAASDKSGFLGGRLNEYHDLVVRMPFTYTPGTYGKCSLTPKPKAFGENGSLGDICFNHVDNDGAKPFTDACSSVDYAKSTNNNDERFDFVISGMASCTNKIRATAARTCIIRKKSNQSIVKKTELGCSSTWDCENPGKYNISSADFAKIKIKKDDEEVVCLGPSDGGEAEKDRQGALNVLEGKEGAYLFCFHPEKPGSQESDCRNFIVPPQSVFISGKGGVYDVIISQFNMIAGGAYGPQRIIDWLYDHKAEVRLYDQYGLNGIWKYRDMNKKPLTSWPPEWGGNVLCPNDYATTGDSKTLATGGVGGGIQGAVAYPTDAGWLPKQYKAFYMTMAGGVNQSWVPFSIDTTSKTVKEWKGGGSGATQAAYRYFADMYTFEAVGQQGAGSGVCWYHTCSYYSGEDSSGQTSNWPPVVDEEQKYLCNDGGGKYSHTPDDPACTAGDMDICVKYYGANTKTCTKTVNPNTRCVRFCTNPKGSDPACTGTVKGSSGAASVNAFCGGPLHCGSSDSDLFR